MPRKQKRYHYIYKTTNLITNKYYIGMHSTNNLKDGYIGSGKRLWYSINKYGKENHICEILEFMQDRKLLKERESEIINIKLLHDPMCLNLVVGGNGGWEHANNKNTTELRRERGKVSYKNGGGVAALKELEKLKQNDEWKAIYSKKISEALKIKSIEIHGNSKDIFKTFLGKKHSTKTKEKLRNRAKGKHNGKKNSQFGTCWICNIKTKEIKKIKLNDLPQWLNNNWIRGRKITNHS